MPPSSCERKEETAEINSLSAKVTNIIGLSGVTHSGHVFVAPDLPARPANTKGKAKEIEELASDAPPTSEEDILAGRFAKKKEGSDRKEASEFLRIIQQSEFKIIEQLNKTPARVSLLELLMSSEPHRALLVKVLNEAQVAQEISVEGFKGIVSNITANNYLTFTEEEIPAEGWGYNGALHITVKCMDHVMAKVLIDNGSSLNVMPKSTLEKLPFNASHLRPSFMVVLAFDGSRREVMGEIYLPVQIGPHTCQVTFQVMDINPVYNCLLDRPWIHSIGVVPSRLHQKLKFMVEGLLVIISGEEDLLVSCPSCMPYVEVTEESLEMTFQSFEVVSNAFVESLLTCPHMSNTTIMVAHIMLGHGYEPGTGLGKKNDGKASLVNVKENYGRFKLGYKPARAGIRKSGRERRNWGTGTQSKMQVREAPPCHLNVSFFSTGLRREEEVSMVHDEPLQEHPDWVQPCIPEFQLGNWRVMERPEVSSASIM